MEGFAGGGAGGAHPVVSSCSFCADNANSQTRKSRTKVELEKWTQEMRLWESAQAAKEDQQGALPAAPSGDTNAKRACTTDDEVAPDAAPKPAKTRKRVHGRASESARCFLDFLRSC